VLSLTRCQVNPTWPKGFARKGAALHSMKRYDDAVEAYTAGQDVAPEDEGLQRGLAEVQAARDSAERRSSASSSPSDPLRNAFGENVMGRLAGHPKFGAYLGDPVFVQRLQAMQANPSSLGQGVNDPRLMEVFGFLLGFDMAGGAGFGQRSGGDAPSTAAAAEAEGGYETDDEDLPPSPPRRGTAAAAAAAVAAAEGKESSSGDAGADADAKGSKESDDMEEEEDVAPRVSAADKKQVLIHFCVIWGRYRYRTSTYACYYLLVSNCAGELQSQ
jgi:stress-induced-phosphoprotein 1